MNTPIDLTILIVNWNTRDLLRDCLRSVEAGLVGVRAEVLLVDNGSTDDSLVMVSREFPTTRVIANPDNRGFAAANNQGIAAARGRHVLLLNSDTVVHGTVLRDSVEYLDRHPEVGAMGCRVRNPDGTLQPSCLRFPTLPHLALLTSGLFRLHRRPVVGAILGRYHYGGFGFDRELDVHSVTGCYLLVRREAIAAAGLLDEAFFFYGEETDWCRRIRDAGFRVRFAPVGEITHLGSGSSRRLDHRRDLLLSEGLVRLHHKHEGRASAAAAWLLLLGFNASRAALWSLASWVRRDARSRQRRGHFVRVVRAFDRTWPAAVTR